MKKNTRLISSSSTLIITITMLVALSYHNMLFACPNAITPLPIIQQNSVVKINHALALQTTDEGDELTEATNASTTKLNYY